MVAADTHYAPADRRLAAARHAHARPVIVGVDIVIIRSPLGKQSKKVRARIHAFLRPMPQTDAQGGEPS